jgi:hypothetical protein
MVLRCLTLLLLFVTLFGCSPRYEYVVLREVPQSPSFVVLAPNRYLFEIEFANMIEEIIISLGVKVVVRPATKAVTETTERGIAGAQAEDNKLMTGERSLQRVESYVEYTDLKADYIVRTYRNSRQIRIIKRQSGEILASINLSENPYVEQRDHYRYMIAGLLHNMGIRATRPAKP